MARQRLTILAFLAATALAALSRPAAADPTMKGPIHGLVTMGSLAFDLNPALQPRNELREANAHPGVYAASVVLATWQQLEPQPGQFDFSPIEKGLAAIRTYNTAHPSAPLVAKLRIFAGLHTPDWVKQLDGGPVTLRRGARHADFAHFWSQPYREAWQRLQKALAARYDTNKLVAEVAVSSCSSTTAEPFIVPLNAANIPALLAAGYTEPAMEACLMGAIDDYAPWQHTAIDYTFNPWRTMASGRPRPDPDFTLQVMKAFRARYGARGVLANHGLGPEVNPPARPVIAEMRRLGPPIEFQSRGPILDWDATEAAGRELGMTELEIWNTHDARGPADVTAAELAAWHKQFEAAP